MTYPGHETNGMLETSKQHVPSSCILLYNVRFVRVHREAASDLWTSTPQLETIPNHQNNPQQPPTMRGNDAVTKCHYKGNTDDFVIIVESEQAVKEWLADRSIPLAQVVNGFKIFVTHK
jgi:hypothetical protein